MVTEETAKKLRIEAEHCEDAQCLYDICLRLLNYIDELLIELKDYRTMQRNYAWAEKYNEKQAQEMREIDLLKSEVDQ